MSEQRLSTTENRRVIRGSGTVMQWYGMYHIKRDARRAKTWVLSHNGEVVDKMPLWDDTYTNEDGQERRVHYKTHEEWGMEYYKDLMKKFLAEDNHTDSTVLLSATQNAIKYVLRNESYRWMASKARNVPVLMATKTQNVRSDNNVSLYTLKTGYDEHTRLSSFGWLDSWKNRYLIDKELATEYSYFIRSNKQLIDLCEAKLKAIDMGRQHKHRVQMFGQRERDLEQAQKALEEHINSMDELTAKWEAQNEWMDAKPKHLTGIAKNWSYYNSTNAVTQDPQKRKASLEHLVKERTNRVEAMRESIEQWNSVHGVDE